MYLCVCLHVRACKNYVEVQPLGNQFCSSVRLRQLKEAGVMLRVRSSCQAGSWESRGQYVSPDVPEGLRLDEPWVCGCWPLQGPPSRAEASYVVCVVGGSACGFTAQLRHPWACGIGVCCPVLLHL